MSEGAGAAGALTGRWGRPMAPTTTVSSECTEQKFYGTRIGPIDDHDDLMIASPCQVSTTCVHAYARSAPGARSGGGRVTRGARAGRTRGVGGRGALARVGCTGERDVHVARVFPPAAYSHQPTALLLLSCRGSTWSETMPGAPAAAAGGGGGGDSGDEEVMVSPAPSLGGGEGGEGGAAWSALLYTPQDVACEAQGSSCGASAGAPGGGRARDAGWGDGTGPGAAAAVTRPPRRLSAPLRLARQASALSAAGSSAGSSTHGGGAAPRHKERLALQRGCALCACSPRPVDAVITEGMLLLQAPGGADADDVEAADVGCCPYCVWCWQTSAWQQCSPLEAGEQSHAAPYIYSSDATEALLAAERTDGDPVSGSSSESSTHHQEEREGSTSRAALMAAAAGRVGVQSIEFSLRENVVSVEFGVTLHGGRQELEYGSITITVIVPAANMLTDPITPRVETLRLEGAVGACRRFAARARAELKADVLRPRRLAVLVGRRSGDGKGPRAWAAAEEVLVAAECGPVEVPIINSVRETARQVAQEAAEADQTGLIGWDGLLVVGGDGILSEAFAGVLEGHAASAAKDGNAPQPLRLGVIPAGSTDAVACGVLGTRESRTAAACVALGRFALLDAVRLASADGAVTRSLSFAGLGLFADTVESSEGLRWLGKARLNLAGAMCFFRGRSYAARVRYRRASDDARAALEWRVAEGKFHLLGAAMETKNAKSPAGLTPTSRRPGTTNLVMVRRTSRFNFLRFLSQLSAGKGEHARHPSFDCLPDVTEFVIENGEEDVPAWQSDGESLLGATDRVEGCVERDAAPLFAFRPMQLIAPDEAARLHGVGPLGFAERKARRWIATELSGIENAAV